MDNPITCDGQVLDAAADYGMPEVAERIYWVGIDPGPGEDTACVGVTHDPYNTIVVSGAITAISPAGVVVNGRLIAMRQIRSVTIETPEPLAKQLEGKFAFGPLLKTSFNAGVLAGVFGAARVPVYCPPARAIRSQLGYWAARHGKFDPWLKQYMEYVAVDTKPGKGASNDHLRDAWAAMQFKTSAPDNQRWRWGYHA